MRLQKERARLEAILAEQKAAALAERDREHQQALGALKKEHAQAMAKRDREIQDELAKLRKEHADEVAALRKEHAQALAKRERESQDELMKQVLMQICSVRVCPLHECRHIVPHKTLVGSEKRWSQVCWKKRPSSAGD